MSTISATATPVQQLAAALAGHPPGSITEDRDKIIGLLRNAWDYFEGSGDTAMAAYKLQPDRVEELCWAPSVISFQIKRHPKMQYGSMWAELWQWHVNLETLEATNSYVKNCAGRPADERLDTKALAQEITALIKHRKKATPKLHWTTDVLVRVNINAVIPESGSCKQTLVGRRSRFARDLAAALLPLGWRPAQGKAPHTYERIPLVNEPPSRAGV
jgi:hypothetical protein